MSENLKVPDGKIPIPQGEIPPQDYPALCERCCLEQGRKDLTTQKYREQLIKFANGRKDAVDIKDIENMRWYGNKILDGMNVLEST